jgi:hypothetical protein
VLIFASVQGALKICALLNLEVKKSTQKSPCFYRVFHRFTQAKFDNGGLILSSSQFLLLSKLPQKMKLASN